MRCFALQLDFHTLALQDEVRTLVDERGGLDAMTAMDWQAGALPGWLLQHSPEPQYSEYRVVYNYDTPRNVGLRATASTTQSLDTCSALSQAHPPIFALTDASRHSHLHLFAHLHACKILETLTFVRMHVHVRTPLGTHTLALLARRGAEPLSIARIGDEAPHDNP